MTNKLKTFIGTGVLAATMVTGIAIGEALAYQSHMMSAMDYLRQARAELVVATADKGGHRVAAIGYVDRAITETRQGMAYAGD